MGMRLILVNIKKTILFYISRMADFFCAQGGKIKFVHTDDRGG